MRLWVHYKCMTAEYIKFSDAPAWELERNISQMSNHARVTVTIYYVQ